MTTLGSLLVQNRIVGVIEIEKALQRQVIVGGDLATNLLELGLVEESALAKHAAAAFGIPPLERSLADAPDEAAVKMMPWAAADEHKVVPMRIDGDKMILAVSSPLPENALAEVGFLLGVEFVQRFVLEFRLALLLNRCFGIPVSKRFVTLRNRLAPEIVLDAPPLVPPPGQDALMSAANAPKKPSMHPTVPADSDYLISAIKASEGTLMPESASDSPSPGPDLFSAATRVPKESPVGRPSLMPMNLEEVKSKLLQAVHRDEILDIFMEAANSVFDYALLFVIQGTDAVAHSMVDAEGNIRRTSHPVVPLEMGGMFQTAFNTGSFYLGMPGKSSEDELIFQEMRRSRPKNCAILPVSLRGRIILMLYGDRGDRGVRAEKISELMQLTRLTAEAFERLLLEKKYGKYRTAASRMPSRPGHAAFSQVPEREGAGLEKSAGLYRFVTADNPGKVAVPAANSDHAGPESDLGAMSTEPTSASLDEKDGSDASVPMAEVSLPLKSKKPPAQLVIGDSPDQGEDISAKKVEAAKIVTLTAAETSRSVMVNMSEEIDRLVTRILDSVKRFDQAALDVLLGMGEDAVKKLVEHFPGPLVCDRYQDTDKLPRVDRHGPLLKALIAFGKVVIPHVLPLLESRDTDIRFYATFLFSELKYPEALDGLTARLFDSDRQIRGIAVDVIRGFSGHPEYRWTVDRIIEALESPARDIDAKRIAAATLGDLGEPGGAEALIGMLDSVDDKLVRATRRALTKITFFDHGFSRRRWEEWHRIYNNKTRIEWALEGLGNEEDTIRRAAWLFLRPRVEEVVETGPDGPVTYRDYKEIQDRLKRWWRDEGRDLHRITTGD